MKNDAKLGDRAKDSISGFEGIVVGVTEWLYGCRRVGLADEKLHEGKAIETQWFDAAQVEVVDRGQVEAQLAEALAPTGGPDRREEKR